MIQDDSLQYDLGDQDSASFTYDDTNGLIISYSTPDRKSFLKCVCGSGNTLSYKGEMPQNNYVKYLRQKKIRMILT